MTTAQTKAVLRNHRVAPRKARLIIDMIRGKSVAEALLQLHFSKKHVARQVLKLLKSAIANADHNHNIDIDSLVVKEAFVDGGPVLKRFRPRAFGRAAAIRKRTSHITIVLEGVVKEGTPKVQQVAATQAVAETEDSSEEKKKPSAKKKASATKKAKADAKEDADNNEA
jgi:large subunit ribosomal protein L22